MPRNFKRLSMAFLLSAACFYGVEHWYSTLNLGVKIKTNQKAVARLSGLTNEVQRKPVTRLIWEVISKNESLYPGESIRTTSSSDATIFFIKTGTTIELEPDSQIIIQGDQDEISLNFVKGNMFVKQDKEKSGTSKAKIKLKTSKGELDIKSASLTLSQSDKGLDLEVYSGKAALTQNGKKVEINSKSTDKKQFLKLISPLPSLPSFISPQKKEPVTYKWRKLPPGYKVYIYRGTKRHKLVKYEKAWAPGEAGGIKIPTKVGKIYWKAVAVPDEPGKEEQSSKTTFAQIVPKTPPVLLQPEDQQKLVLTKEKQVPLKWTAHAKTTGLILEVAKDRGLKNKVKQESLNDKVTNYVLPISSPGEYFWRVTGFIKIKDKMEPVSSPIKTFKVSFKAPLIPPKLKSPMNSQSLPYEKAANGGVYFTWEPLEGIAKYKIYIAPEAKPTEDPSKPTRFLVAEEVKAPPYRWVGMESGNYQWYITSINNVKKESKPSETRVFQVGKIPEVLWTTGIKKSRYQYVTATPSIYVSWQKNIPKTTSWRIRYAQDSDFIETADWKTIEQNVLKGPIPQAGEWNVQVEALDANKRTIARSAVKTVVVVEKPLLRGPAYAPNMSSPLKSSRRGVLNVEWSPVMGAQKYHVQMLDEAGAVVNNLSSTEANTTFRGLAPGKYKVSIKSVDEHDRPGPVGEVRELIVPDSSNIKAPKIKKVKVK